MSRREPIPTWCFSLVVVRQGRRFLLVHERKHGQLWYLPAGRVEPGETFADAAIRETREEAGIDIALEGILRVEHSLSPGGARHRVIYVARPTNDAPPKSIPDEETLGAAWVALDEIGDYPLRGEEVLEMFQFVERGGPIYPLDVLTTEGSPWPRAP